MLELCKRYKDRDIAVVYKTCQYEMILKIKKYCRVYELHKEDRIKCKVMVINFDSTVCDQVEDRVYDQVDKGKIIENRIYMTLHADYSNEIYKGGHPDFRPRIDSYIAITKHIQKWLKKECNIESQVIYNPLTIDNEKCLILMSATRMSKQKGKDRTIKLGEALNKAGVNYKWFIFTPNTDKVDNPNIIYVESRTDLDKIMHIADYGVQLSDSEGLSYTINEFLYRNIPVITTPLPYLDEIGYKDGETGYIVEFDCSNVDEVAKKIKKVPKFKFEPLNDSYDEIFTKAKSHYVKDINTMVWVVCTYALGFLDMEVNAWRTKGELWQVNKIRAYDLLNSKDNQGKPIQLIRLVKDETELKELQEAWEIKQQNKRI